jgi:predicted Zn-dependent peptidase
VLAGLAIPAGALNLADFERQVTEHTLDNGMHFIIVERHDAPVVSFMTHVDVGSVNEKVGTTGLAHLFEHMAFKGTKEIGSKNPRKESKALERVDRAYADLAAERAKGDAASKDQLERLQAAFEEAQAEAEEWVEKNEFDSALQTAGSSGLNAGTGADFTKYMVSLPSNRLELWAYLESERFWRPVLREFYKERDVVMEERRMNESRPVGRLIEEFLAAAYKAHPYGSPTLGHMSDLQQLTRQDAEAFYSKYYVPSNTTVAIVGDVDPKRTIELVERYFGRIPRRPTPRPVTTVEPPQRGEKIVVVDDPSQPIYLVGYHKPASTDPDEAVYAAISDILGQGRTSRLHKRLVKQDKIAIQTGAFPGLPGEKYPNLLLFIAVPSVGHTNDEVAKAIDEELERLRTEPVSDEELDGVKARARAQLLRRLSSNQGMAWLLTDFQVLNGDWRELFRYVEHIESVTAEDIMRVADETLVRRNRIVGEVETEEDSEKGGES